MNVNLPYQKIRNENNQYKYADRVKTYIKNNNAKAKDYLKKYNFKGVFGVPNYDKLYSISGSFKVNSLSKLNQPAYDYFVTNNGRYFLKQNDISMEYHLRGPLYVLALDPHLSVIQKLDFLSIDIKDAINSIKNYQIDANQYLSISPVLDYLKNSLITLFNSYIHQEKGGELKTNDIKYKKNRELLIEFIESSVLSYYLSLVDKFDKITQHNLISTLDLDLVENVLISIKGDFRNFTFSSKSMVRPEASHPLVLLNYSINLANTFKNTDFIFGMPSGSTEIAILTYSLIKHLHSKKECKLILIPISLHSIKDTGKDPFNFNHLNFQKLFSEFQCKSENCTALVIDDNSASGKTLEKIYHITKKHFKNTRFILSVAEADLIRIDLKMKSASSEDTFCHSDIFKHSTHILPISKFINPKCDLKEVIERRLLYHHFLSRPKSNIIEQIIDEVIADSIEYRIEDNFENFNNSNAILVFKETWLSNFYEVNFVYKGRKYNSVEQAYLRQKFDSAILLKLTQNQKEELNEILRVKGVGVTKDDFSAAFYDFNLTAGILKRWSNKLKSWGLEDQDWDSKRLKIMTELLLLKFSNEIFMEKLLATENKYLIEGNEWNDTFWGVCNKRGRNYLGRIIMNIRDKILIGQIDIQQLISSLKKQD